MKKGIISSLYPTTKALIIFLGLFLYFFFDWRFAYFFVLPLCIFLALIDGKVITYLQKVFVALAVFVLFIFLFKIILEQKATPVLFSIGFVKVTEAAVLGGLNQTGILVVLVATIILFFETTEMEDLMISLQELRMSHVVSYIVLSTIQLIPDMMKKSKVIMQAQQARGIETQGSLMRRLKAFFPSLGPLIISSIADIEDRSITLEVRGFSSENKKTHLKEIRRGHLDLFVVIILLASTIGAILLKVFL
jgi:energy-coupling factor transport system permease protein